MDPQRERRKSEICARRGKNEFLGGPAEERGPARSGPVEGRSSASQSGEGEVPAERQKKGKTQGHRRTPKTDRPDRLDQIKTRWAISNLNKHLHRALGHLGKVTVVSVSCFFDGHSSG